jgi:hypothetical protein
MNWKEWCDKNHPEWTPYERYQERRKQIAKLMPNVFAAVETAKRKFMMGTILEPYIEEREDDEQGKNVS